MKTTDAAEPADCHLGALHLAATIEQLRRELGRPVDPRPPAQVSGAQPRECWFAALALHTKAARLADELGLDPSAPLDAPPAVDQLRPGHVLQVIEAAQRHLDAIRERLGVPAATATAKRDPGRTPSDVFGVLATTSRQLDRLLARPTSPGDVFEQVALALAYHDHALALPAFEHGKVPADCLQRLREALDVARGLVRRAGHPVIDHAPAALDATPSDCFDVATLVLGEVAFLHALAPARATPAAYAQVRAGRKLPSHVYQLVGALVAQLDRLSR